MSGVGVRLQKFSDSTQEIKVTMDNGDIDHFDDIIGRSDDNNDVKSC